MWKRPELAQTQWFFISCKGLCTQIVWTNPQFQFMTTIVISMATKSSDLDDCISGVNLQNNGHTPTSPSGVKGLEEMGASGSAPSHSPPWSPERWPSPGHPGTQYCLGICITLTEKRGAAPPLSHTLDCASGGGHAMTWQSWPHQSSSDRPRKGYSVLWETFPRRRPAA